MEGGQFTFQKLEGDDSVSNGNLKIKKVSKTDLEDEKELINIKLEGYEIDVDNIPVKEKYKEIIKGVLEDNSLNLIDYISIDPDYDGNIFISRWQDFREKDRYKIYEDIELKVSKKLKRNIAVEVIDVFGFQSRYVLEI